MTRLYLINNSAPNMDLKPQNSIRAMYFVWYLTFVWYRNTTLVQGGQNIKIYNMKLPPIFHMGIHASMAD